MQKLKFNEIIQSLRDENKEYPKRKISLEETTAILVHEIYTILHNKIERMTPYDKRDSGWSEAFEVIDDKMDKIISLLKDMNIENWEMGLNEQYETKFNYENGTYSYRGFDYTNEASKNFERLFMPLEKLIDIFKDNEIQEIKMKSKLTGELFKIIINDNIFTVEKI
jgi:predicted metal-dependent peptidase